MLPCLKLNWNSNYEIFVNTFDIEIRSPIQVYDDNFGAVFIAINRNLSKKYKYIEVHYSFVHEFINKRIIIVVKITSETKIADILTNKQLGASYEKENVHRKCIYSRTSLTRPFVDFVWFEGCRVIQDISIYNVF